MNDETYEGWTNRETWALNLWLTNDEGLYEMTRAHLAAVIKAYTEGYEPGDGLNLSDALPRVAADAVEELWEELTDPDEGLMTAENILKMVRDVGSEYRVDWDEIGRHWLEDVTENPVES